MKIHPIQTLLLAALVAVSSELPAAERSARTAAKPRAEALTARIAAQALPPVGGTWTAQGPAPIVDGQTEGSTMNGEVSGAVNALVAHPTNAAILWAGAVNGGVWKTTNATAASPGWTTTTDAFGSLSIGTLERDPTDATHNTLVAGFGRFSSFSSVGGPRTGLLRTTNGGTSWTALNPANLTGLNITAVAPRGATIVLAADFSDSFTCETLGIFRSTNTGASFTRISGAAGSGLPLGRAFDLASHPANNAILYTAIRDAQGCSPGSLNGVYKSVDTGATWTKVSNAAMDALLTDNGGQEGTGVGNVRLAVGMQGEVYAGIIVDRRLAGLFRSGTAGASWTQLDTPVTNENGTPIGIQPGGKPGGQGNLHFSIAADPTNANIVYVGGDRQPGNGDGDASFPNSIGAVNYTGRLFRVNAAAGAGSQATPLTHCATATAACNSTISTTGNSAPHADSRAIVFDAAGNLLESDDGGIYRRTDPRGTGDWFSVNGNLPVVEIHDVAYDTTSNMIIGGNQDTGTAEQTEVNGTVWNQVNQGDGGDVAVDDSSATQSFRYSSAQNLGGFAKRTVNTAGGATSFVFPSLTVLGGGPLFQAPFVTPVAVNNITPSRMLFAGGNDLYESLDRGDTITALGLNLPAEAMVFGGRSGGVDNVNLIYAISGTAVYVRTAGAGAPVATGTAPGASTLRDIAVDPNDWQKAYVINAIGQVWSTPNAGGTWTNITGNLGSGTVVLRTVAFVPGSPAAVVVGGDNGVFRMAVDNAGVWNQFGTGLSNAPVWDLDYDPTDDVLVAATMGRGAWKLQPASNLGPLPSLSINDVAVAEGNAGTTNATFTVTLSAASAGTVTVNYATSSGTAAPSGATSTNAAAVSISSGAAGPATPYPSTIAVAGLSGTITKVTARLNGLQHDYVGDTDVLLVGPGGQSVVLLSDAGGGAGVSGVTVTFDDDAATTIAGVPATGTFKPTNNEDGEGGDTYPSPAPAAPYGATLSVFDGTAPNGTWSLYVTDDFDVFGGSLAGGWTLSIETTGGDYQFASGTVTFLPGVTSQNVIVPVIGDVASEPNETFFVHLTSPSNATIADAQAQGTINNDDGGLAAPTNVVATASTATTVGLTWTAAAGAASYRVYRSHGAGFTLIGSPATNSFSDPTAAANTAYLYKVRSFNGTESGDSNIDLATTVLFTDPTLTASTTRVKHVHFTELLACVNAVRTLAAMAPIAFTAPAPATTVTLRRQHILDLRAGLDAARTTLTLTPLTHTDPTLTAQSTHVKAAHITGLRNGVR